MYYYSKKSNRKIIHTEKCFITKELDSEFIGTFDTLHKAFSKGYRLCRRCNSIAKQYNKMQDTLIDYCYRNGMSCYYSDRYFKVHTPASNWIITVLDSGNTALYHKNTKTLASDACSAIPGYHDQRISYGNLKFYFDYIKKHDLYRYAHPETIKAKKAAASPPKKGTKRWRKAQVKMKRIQRRTAINNVLRMIESLDSNYSVRVTA